MRAMFVPAAACLLALAVAAPPPDAVAAAPSAPSPTPTPSPAPDDHLLGPFRLGVMLGAGGLPRALNAAILLKYKDVVGVGVSYGFFPKYEYIDSASLSMWGAELEGRWYPFRGAFFVGGGLAYQSLDATVRSFARDRVATASGPALVVRAGWHWVFKSGLSLGVDLGLQYMIAPSIDGDKDRNAREIADIVSSAPLPTLNLLRIGYFL